MTLTLRVSTFCCCYVVALQRGIVASWHKTHGPFSFNNKIFTSGLNFRFRGRHLSCRCRLMSDNVGSVIFGLGIVGKVGEAIGIASPSVAFQKLFQLLVSTSGCSPWNPPPPTCAFAWQKTLVRPSVNSNGTGAPVKTVSSAFDSPSPGDFPRKNGIDPDQMIFSQWRAQHGVFYAYMPLGHAVHYQLIGCGSISHCLSECSVYCLAFLLRHRNKVLTKYVRNKMHTVVTGKWCVFFADVDNAACWCDCDSSGLWLGPLFIDKLIVDSGSVADRCFAATCASWAVGIQQHSTTFSCKQHKKLSCCCDNCLMPLSQYFRR